MEAIALLKRIDVARARLGAAAADASDAPEAATPPSSVG